MKNIIIATTLLFAISTPALATTCKIVGISDGDTATCLTANNQQIKIRFDQIDAPEKAQDFGTVSRQALSDMIFGKEVTIREKTTDKYGRTVAEVFVGNTNINKEMVKKGYAWAYREYLTDNEYLALEAQAKSQKLGLWSHPNPIYPSDFRKSSRGSGSGGSNSHRASMQALPTSNSGSCANVKRTCGQMNSCAEARRALACGVTQLDRDKDGVPCESICR